MDLDGFQLDSRRFIDCAFGSGNNETFKKIEK